MIIKSDLRASALYRRLCARTRVVSWKVKKCDSSNESLEPRNLRTYLRSSCYGPAIRRYHGGWRLQGGEKRYSATESQVHGRRRSQSKWSIRVQCQREKTPLGASTRRSHWTCFPVHIRYFVFDYCLRLFAEFSRWLALTHSLYILHDYN